MKALISIKNMRFLYNSRPLVELSKLRPRYLYCFEVCIFNVVFKSFLLFFNAFRLFIGHVHVCTLYLQLNLYTRERKIGLQCVNV